MFTPRLHIAFFRTRIHSFHFFGVLGYILGVVLGVALASLLQLQPLIVLLMAGTSAAVFFLLAFIAKWITREETIVYYHHEIGIMICCSLVLYFIGLPVLPYLDITLLGIGVFLAFGRIGCYSVGCCHGKPHKHGVVYGQQHVDAGFTWFYKDVPLFPVQLIESAYVFITVITGVILLFMHVAPGTVLIIYTVVYGFMRFILEYFRGDPDRPLWNGLSEAQWTTIILTTVTLILGRIGWLPAYNWHAIILLVMLLAAATGIYRFRKNAQQELFMAPHIRQLAEGLDMLDDANAKKDTVNDKRINIYTTKKGLSVSCNRPQIPAGAVHYTISSGKKNMMNRVLAEKMATVIAVLKHHNGGYELVEKQNGIYHILFGEELREVSE